MLHPPMRLFGWLAVFAWLAVSAGSHAATAPVARGNGEHHPTDTPAWQCWDPGDVMPCHTMPYALDFLSPVDGWAVGYQGLTAHWDGIAWTSMDTPATIPYLNAVDALSPTEAWAVGADNTVLRWDGVDWDLAAAPQPGGTLRDVVFLATDDGWVTGSGGSNSFTAHWDGSAWTVYPMPSQINAIAAAAPDDVWAVGWVVMHWDGTGWSQIGQVGAWGDLQDVVALSADDVWLVGSYLTAIHWDGTNWTWTTVTGPAASAQITTVTALGSDEVWAAGWDEGQGLFVVRWDGQAWTMRPERFYNCLPSSMAMLSASDGWIVAGNQGKLLRWDAHAWRVVSEPGGPAFGDFAFFAADDAWAVGGTFTGSLVMHWDGVTWTRVPSEPEWGFSGVSFLSHTDGWAVGWDYVAHENHSYFARWDGASWVTVVGPITDTQLYDIVMVSPTDGWAVGSLTCYACEGHGRIYHWDGSVWNQFSTARRGLFAVSAAAADDTWAVGYEGVIVHWDGTNWTEVASPTTNHLESIAMRSAVDGWACGGEGVFHWDGSAWTQSLGTFATLYSITASSSTDVWAAGWAGLVVRWDGATWTEMPRLVAWDYYDISMFSPTEGWASASQGTLVHYTTRPSRYTVYLPQITANTTGCGTPGE